MIISGISEPMSFKGHDGNTVSGYRVDTSEPYDNPKAFGYRSDHGFISLDKMRPEYFNWAEQGSLVIALRSRSGKINGFVLA